MHDSPEVHPLQFAVVDEDDVRQEAELLRLLGKVPNKRIIRSRLQGQQRSLLSGELPEESIPIGFLTQTPTPSDETIEALVDWALTQVAPVQEAFFTFLEDPETHLLETLQLLRKYEVLQSQNVQPTKSVSLSSIFTSALPATKEQLYELARSIQDRTERPEATVRQWLRRNLRNGLLEQDGEGRYISRSTPNDAPDR